MQQYICKARICFRSDEVSLPKY